MQDQKMSDAARADHLIEGLQRIESLVAQLASSMNAAVEDIEALGKAGYREGGGIPGVDKLLAAGATVEGLYGSVRGRIRAHGLEQLLQRTSTTTNDDWVTSVAERLRRVVA